MSPPPILIHNIRSFILPDDSSVTCAVPHIFKHTMVPLSSTRFTIQPAGSSNEPLKWYPVITSGCDFTDSTLVPPRTPSLTRQNVRFAAPGASLPLWSLQYDGMLVHKSEPEKISDDCTLVLTVERDIYLVDAPQSGCEFVVFAVLTDSLVGLNSIIILPFCPFERGVITGMHKLDGNTCVLDCREIGGKGRVSLTFGLGYVDLSTFDPLSRFLRWIWSWAALTCTAPMVIMHLAFTVTLGSWVGDEPTTLAIKFTVHDPEIVVGQCVWSSHRENLAVDYPRGLCSARADYIRV
ncbi:hypothetical protein DFH09DRAFT_1279179 [Mycena vulgaris]|nr:hypothetical protein DFH09DRAFT_1279179 [Mycena vulgaris]